MQDERYCFVVYEPSAVPRTAALSESLLFPERNNNARTAGDAGPANRCAHLTTSCFGNESKCRAPRPLGGGRGGAPGQESRANVDSIRDVTIPKQGQQGPLLGTNVRFLRVV